MAVTEQSPTSSFTANGVTTVFAFAFLLLQESDLVVQVTDTSGVVTTKTLGVDYTIAGVGVATGGTVTFTAAPASDYKVVIFRDSAIERATDYQNNGDLLAETVNKDFDRLWLVLQEIFNGGKGAPTSLRVPNGETIAALPVASDRASKVLAFDSAGNPILIVGVDASSAAALQIDLASSASAAKGSGMLGFAYALAYGAGTIGKWLQDLALSTGADNIGIAQSGAGAVTETVKTALRRTWYPEQFGADPTGATDSTAALQEALNALPQYGELILDGNYKHTGLSLTDRNNLAIGGKGRIFLSGAASGAFGIQLIGTCDDLTFDGLSIAGESNVAYSQTGIGNNSGQTLSGLRYLNLKVSGLNVGLSMTGNGGSCDKWFSSGCRIDSMVGTASGQGYGFHVDNATNGQCIGVRVNDASRHSLYHGRGSGNVFIAPILTNHRLTAHDGINIRCALVISRSSGVQVIGGEVRDAWDGQLEISPDTSTLLNCADIVVDGLLLVGRKNSVYGINVGEQTVPSGYMARNIRLRLDVLDDHAAVAGGAAAIINNVSGLSMRGTRMRRTGITGTTRFVSLGNSPYINADADCTDTILQGMEFVSEGSVLTDVRAIDIDAELCVNNSVHTIGPNITKNVTTEASFQATQTNKNIIFTDAQSTRLGVYTAGDTTPSVRGVNVLIVSNAGAVTLTALTNGIANQQVTLRNTGAGTCTLAAANFYTPGGVNLVLGQNDVATLICRATGGAWEVVSTSNN